MFVQTEVTPNPNSLKFLPGKKVSNSGPYEITNKEDMKNELVRNILSINGVEGIFLGQDFISVNKNENIKWDEIKHIVISLINDFYADGKEFVIDKNIKELDERLEAKNLLGIYSSLTNSTLENSVKNFSGKNFSEFKEQLAEELLNKIEPISNQIKKLLEDKKFLDEILLDGVEKANMIASKKIESIKEIVGF